MVWEAQMASGVEDLYMAECGDLLLQLSRGIDGEESDAVVLDLIDGCGEGECIFSARIDKAYQLTEYNFKHAEQLARKFAA